MEVWKGGGKRPAATVWPFSSCLAPSTLPPLRPSTLHFPVLPSPPAPQPRRVLFVFAWLVVGGEETELRHLARHLDPARWQLDVAACFRKPNMPEQTHEQLQALGVARGPDAVHPFL